MKNLLWNLFKQTGDLRYYNLLKGMENIDENRKSERHNNK